MLTSPGVTLDKAEMCNICMWVEGAKLPETNLPVLYGQVYNVCLFYSKISIGKDYIFQGKLLKGPLGKKALGRSHGSIIHRLYNDYGPDRTCQFINELQENQSFVVLWPRVTLLVSATCASPTQQLKLESVKNAETLTRKPTQYATNTKAKPSPKSTVF